MENNETVKIAPKMSEINISDKRDSIYCNFGGSKVTFTLPKGIAFNHDDMEHKKAFQVAIAFSHNKFQIEHTMNSVYNVRGRVSVEQLKDDNP